jgi:hypothetical protein
VSFAVRPYTDEDRDFVVSSWLFSFARSAYGMAHGAHVTSAVQGHSKRPEKAAWDAYWAEQEPIVRGLIARSEIAIACDPAAPEVIWGWACTSGDTVHYALAKRSVHAASAKEAKPGMWEVTTGLSGDIYRALLGDRLKRACGYTYELVDMRRRELRAQGVTQPREWYADGTWFERQRRAA